MIADLPRWSSALRQHRASLPNVSSIPIMRAQQGRSDATGVTAAPIELTATYVREGGKMIRMQTALPK